MKDSNIVDAHKKLNSQPLWIVTQTLLRVSHFILFIMGAPWGYGFQLLGKQRSNFMSNRSKKLSYPDADLERWRQKALEMDEDERCAYLLYVGYSNAEL
ncbi:MAG: hypothetical protein EZS28_041429, partial [Streblomastix strix]